MEFSQQLTQYLFSGLATGAIYALIGIGFAIIYNSTGIINFAQGEFVMLGGMFAGHDESGGELLERGGQHFKLFYGMSSSTAMDKHAGGVAEYRSSEGKTVEVPYRGPIEETVRDILGGVRSACTYVGASALKELTKRTTFIRVAEQESRTFS